MRLEYLDFPADGKACVDTGLKITADMNARIDFKFTSGEGASGYVNDEHIIGTRSARERCQLHVQDLLPQGLSAERRGGRKELIMNLIPAMVNGTTIAGFYDKIGDKFILASGSGVITGGPEWRPPGTMIFLR